MDTSWSAVDVHKRAMHRYAGGTPASWSAVDVHNHAVDSIGWRQDWPDSGGIGNGGAGWGPGRGPLELDQAHCAPGGGSEDILAKCQALRQQWATVKNDAAFGALQKLSGVTPDASAYAPGGGGGGPDLSSALALLKSDMPDLETFRQNARTMPDLETFRRQRISSCMPYESAPDAPVGRWHVSGRTGDLEAFRQQRTSSYVPFESAPDTPAGRWHVSGRTGGDAGQTVPAWPSWTPSPWVTATPPSASRAVSPPPAPSPPAASAASPPSPWGAPSSSWAPPSPSAASPLFSGVQLSPAPAAAPSLLLGARGAGLGAATRSLSPAGYPSWTRA